jgi:hypothetical protein
MRAHEKATADRNIHQMRVVAGRVEPVKDPGRAPGIYCQVCDRAGAVFEDGNGRPLCGRCYRLHLRAVAALAVESAPVRLAANDDVASPTLGDVLGAQLFATSAGLAKGRGR